MEFRVILSYRMSSRPAWVTRDPVEEGREIEGRERWKGRGGGGGERDLNGREGRKGSQLLYRRALIHKKHAYCLVGKSGVCPAARLVACKGQVTAMVTFLLANLILFPLCICIQMSE